MNRFSSKHGFTLIELIMTIVIGTIISIIVGPMLLQGFNAYFESAVITDFDGQAKLAMERMVREIRGIDTPASDITTMTASQLTFTLNGTSISYSLSGNQLNRNSNPLASKVSGLTFTYFQKDLVTTATGPSNVWLVKIQFTLSYSGGAVSTTCNFRNSVFLRNA